MATTWPSKYKFCRFVVDSLWDWI